MLVYFAVARKLASEAENEPELNALNAMCQYVAENGLQLRLSAEDVPGVPDDDDGDALGD